MFAAVVHPGERGPEAFSAVVRAEDVRQTQNDEGHLGSATQVQLALHFVLGVIRGT